MRRMALFSVILLLPGCGLGTFLSDTQTLKTHPNTPLGDSENMRRVRGMGFDETPLQPEPGQVWPNPDLRVPSLTDLRKQRNLSAPEFSPDIGGPVDGFVPPPQPKRRRGKQATPPAATTPGTGGSTDVTIPPGVPELAIPGNGGKYDTLIGPNGQNGGVVVPNGNGTSTVIEPNGTVHTIPTPK